MPQFLSHGRGPAMLVLALALLAGCKKNSKKDTGDGTDPPPANPGNPFIPGARLESAKLGRHRLPGGRRHATPSADSDS